MKWILYVLGFLAGQLTVLFGWMVWMDRRITKFSDRVDAAYGAQTQHTPDYTFYLTRAPKEPRP